MITRYFYKGFECCATYLGGTGIFYAEIACGHDLIITQSKRQKDFNFCFQAAIDNYLQTLLERYYVPLQ